jgi:hypothetical protein
MTGGMESWGKHCGMLGRVLKTEALGRMGWKIVQWVNGMGWAIGSKEMRRWRNSEHHR